MPGAPGKGGPRGGKGTVGEKGSKGEPGRGAVISINYVYLSGTTIIVLYYVLAELR